MGSVIQQNNIISFKGRKLDTNKPIRVYRHVRHKNPKLYSIFQNGKVVGHATQLMMFDCKFVVNQKGRKRVRKEKVKNVHAWIEGFIAPFGLLMPLKVEYNPYKNEHFVVEGRNIFGSDGVSITQDGVFASSDQRAISGYWRSKNKNL